MTDPASARRRNKGLAVSFADTEPPSVTSSSSANTTPSNSPSLRANDDIRGRSSRTYARRKHHQPRTSATSTASDTDPNRKPAGAEASATVMGSVAGPSDEKRWSVPYDASDGEEVQVHIHTPARRHGRGSPSPSRRDLPRLDFSRTNTPLRAKAFASTPLKSALASSTSSSSTASPSARDSFHHRDTLYAEDDSPGKMDRPGRQISLNGLDFFDAAELEKVANIDATEGLETLAEAEEPPNAVDILRPADMNRSAAPAMGTPPSQPYRPRSFVRGLPRSGSESSFVSALSVKGVLCRAEASYTDVLDAYTADTEGEDESVLGGDVGYESQGDADAVDLTLDFDGLSIVTNRSAKNVVDLSDPPRTPRAVSAGFAEAMSAHASSSSSSPPTTVPSVPGTPVQELNEISDSDDWVPQAPRSVRRRRIMDSDDEAPLPEPKTISQMLILSDGDSPLHTRTRLRTPEVAQRRNRLMGTPAALQKLLDLDASDGEEDSFETAPPGDDTYGSLKDFIVDDDDVSDYGENECIDLRPGSRGSPIELMDSDEDDDDNAGIISYSPTPGPLALPDIGELNLDDSDDEAILAPRKQIVPPPRASSTQWSKKEWTSRREVIANQLFAELDAKVFDSRLGAKGAGAYVEWNNRLLTTAGTAHKSRSGSGYTYKIKLSDKVCTGEAQIASTLAHEMCHLACWIISNEHKSPHGRVFKSWGAKVMRYRPDIEVTTRHSYEIEYKFEWECSNAVCGKVYRRHSKSIDPTRQVCGSCKGRLVPRFQTTTSPFQVYLKNNMALAKSALPGASHGDVMRALSKRWADAAGASEEEHVQYWRYAASAASTSGVSGAAGVTVRA